MILYPYTFINSVCLEISTCLDKCDRFILLAHFLLFCEEVSGCQCAVMEMPDNVPRNSKRPLNWRLLKRTLDCILKPLRSTNFGVPPSLIEVDVPCARAENEELRILEVDITVFVVVYSITHINN